MSFAGYVRLGGAGRLALGGQRDCLIFFKYGFRRFDPTYKTAPYSGWASGATPLRKTITLLFHKTHLKGLTVDDLAGRSAKVSAKHFYRAKAPEPPPHLLNPAPRVYPGSVAL